LNLALAFAANPILVTVKAVGIRVGNVVPDAEAPVRDVTAVEVRRSRGDTHGRIACVAVARRRRRRRYPAAPPQSSASSLRGSLRRSIGAEALESALEHVNLPEPALDELAAKVTIPREDEVGEQASVTIPRVLGRVADQPHILPLSKLARPRPRLASVALGGTQLGCVDADEPDALALPGAKENIDGVAVHNRGHPTIQKEAAALDGRCRRGTDEKHGDRAADERRADDD
jgi:hypothetical protein